MEIVKRYERGEGSYESLANEVGVDRGTIRKWFVHYKNLVTSAFDEKSRNKSYTKEFKEKVVQVYLNGKGSYLDVAATFDIPSDATVINWVKKYNGHIEQTDYKSMGDVYMTKSRNTTQEERKEILDYCLAHDKNYKLTAKAFEVPYANVYQWVQKYIKNGYDGLFDKRGHHKSEDELDEVELLRRKLEKAERELKVAQLENRLLKKVDEIERRRYGERAGLRPSTRPSKKPPKN